MDHHLVAVQNKRFCVGRSPAQNFVVPDHIDPGNVEALKRLVGAQDETEPVDPRILDGALPTC